MSPKLSIIVSVSGPPAAVARMLRTLAVPYQLHVTADDYEVLVLEDPAAERLDPEELARIGSNFRSVSPGTRAQPLLRVRAALGQAAAPLVGFLESLAVLTPRLVEHALMAHRATLTPLLVVPAYDLDEPRKDDSGPLDGTDAADGYEALTISRPGVENASGYLVGLFESRSFFCTRAMLDELVPKGVWALCSSVDDIYALLIAAPKTRLIVLGGEASIREREIKREPAPGSWNRAEREPWLFAALPGQGRELFRTSILASAWHQALLAQLEREEWPLDPRGPLPVGADQAPENSAPEPLVSIVVVVFRMSRQAENTLRSLSASHQWNVREEDYEIIVVENTSSDMLGRERALATGRNVRYFERSEPGVSPVPAFNFGVSQARAPLLGLMIDGARMVTPRVLENVLMARHLCERPLIVVPGYHIGPERQFLTSKQGYDETVEQELLRSIDWPRNGHRLFEISSFDDTTLQGFMNPLLESTCLFCPRECLDEVGGADERFDLAGGGIVNLDLFERLCRLERTKLVVLWAEGAFHQYHGGTSSKSLRDRDALLELFRQQYQQIRGRPYGTWDREPFLFGAFVGPSHHLHVKSADEGKVRYTMIREWGRPEWPHE